MTQKIEDRLKSYNITLKNNNKIQDITVKTAYTVNSPVKIKPSHTDMAVRLLQSYNIHVKA